MLMENKKEPKIKKRNDGQRKVATYDNSPEMGDIRPAKYSLNLEDIISAAKTGTDDGMSLSTVNSDTTWNEDADDERWTHVVKPTVDNEQLWKEERFKKYTEEMFDIFRKKNQDYTGSKRIGSSFDATYDLLGPVSPVTRFLDKVFRYLSLAEGKEQLVEDEKITDTLTDLANYALLTRLKIEWDEARKKAEK